MSKCANCNKELIADHAFCPNCGHDLRQYYTTVENNRPESLIKEKSSFLKRLGSPSGSIGVSLFIGTIVMDMINGYFSKYLTDRNADIASLIGTVLGAGFGFLIVVLIPSLTISLIAYAIKKKFPKDEFATMIYVFTVLVSWFFLSTLY